MLFIIQCLLRNDEYTDARKERYKGIGKMQLFIIRSQKDSILKIGGRNCEF